MVFLTQLKNCKNHMFLHFYATGRNPDEVYGYFSCKMNQTRILAGWKDSMLDCMLLFLVTVPRNKENRQKPDFLQFSNAAILQKNPAQKHQKNGAV